MRQMHEAQEHRQELMRLTQALANEWALHKVQANAIAPGYVNTDNTEALRNDPIRTKAVVERIPTGRWGEPDDFKGPIVVLATQCVELCYWHDPDGRRWLDGTLTDCRRACSPHCSWKTYTQPAQGSRLIFRPS